MSNTNTREAESAIVITSLKEMVDMLTTLRDDKDPKIDYDHHEEVLNQVEAKLATLKETHREYIANNPAVWFAISRLDSKINVTRMLMTAASELS